MHWRKRLDENLLAIGLSLTSLSQMLAEVTLSLLTYLEELESLDLWPLLTSKPDNTPTKKIKRTNIIRISFLLTFIVQLLELENRSMIGDVHLSVATCNFSYEYVSSEQMSLK